MSLHQLGGGDEILFAPQMPTALHQALQQAVITARHDRDGAERLFQQLVQQYPHQLTVPIALYKFYFYQGRLVEAEKIVRETLAKAAVEGAFSPEWQLLAGAGTRWEALTEPQRVYLYSLKALGFIMLRRGELQQAEEVLASLERLDPRDLVGGSVVRALAAEVVADE